MKVSTSVLLFLLLFSGIGYSQDKITREDYKRGITRY